MPNLLKIEENENNLPVLCMFGYSPGVREEFVRLNSKKFRIIIVGTKKPSYLSAFPEVYFLTFKNARLLPKLQETIDYSIIFLSDNEAVNNLAPLIEKVHRDKSQTLAVLNPNNINSDLPNIKALESFSNLRYCLIGEILSPEVKSNSIISKIIENAILNHEIRLTGEEDGTIFCVSLSDAMLGIQRLLFGNFKRDVVHLLFYKNPENILDAVHTIAKIEPDLKIIFSDKSTNGKGLTRNKLEKAILQNTNMNTSYVDSLSGFEKSVENFFLQKKDFEKAVLERTKKRKFTKKATPTIRAIKYSLVSFFAGVFLFIFLNLTFFGLGMLYLQSSIQNIERSNFENAVTDARISNFFLSIIKPTVELTFEAISTIDSQGQTQQTYRLLRKAGELSEISGKTISNILKKTSLTEGELLSSIASFSFIYQEGQRINTKNPNPTLARELKKTYSNLLSLSQVLPEVLGFEGKKNYLLLFQNNEELRPTGGFIGSIGYMTMENGKINNFEIQDVYELDGQLKNHVEPPFVVRKNLQKHLYLRDSNFRLNFQEAASQSAFIYNLETGREPDAVIAINLNVLKHVMEVAGPITLPSYNVTVNSKTIAQFLQNTIEDNFFPGSTQKKDVLNSVFASLLQRVEKDPKFNVSIIKIIPELLEKKDILIAFSDTSIQKVFSANGYAGSYEDTRMINSKTIYDYLYVNEANIGVNKVNSLISRTLTYRGQLGQEALTSEASLKLTNASKSDDYKVYLTFVVPGGSSLQKIKINGIDQALTQAVTDPDIYEQETFVQPDTLEVEQYLKYGLTHISFLTTAPKNGQSEITISYKNGAGKTLTNLSGYSLLLVKQPGIESFKFFSIYEYPEGYIPNGITASSYGSNFFEKNYEIDNDSIIEFELQKKQ